MVKTNDNILFTTIKMVFFSFFTTKDFVWTPQIELDLFIYKQKDCHPWVHAPSTNPSRNRFCGLKKARYIGIMRGRDEEQNWNCMHLLPPCFNFQSINFISRWQGNLSLSSTARVCWLFSCLYCNEMSTLDVLRLIMCTSASFIKAHLKRKRKVKLLYSSNYLRIGNLMD